MAAGAGLDKLAEDFRQGRFAPLYLFYGEEDFLMDELQRLLLDSVLQPHERDFNLDIFFGPEADVRNVLSACGSYPMMAERRVVIVTSFEQLADNRDFTAYAENANPSAVVLLICRGKVNMTTHPYRAIKKHGVAVEFSPLHERELPAWIARRAGALGLDMGPAAAQMLAQDVGSDLRVLTSEIDKLRTYLGDRANVTPDDVLVISGHQREYNVFELQRALVDGNRRKAMAIVTRMLEQASNRAGEAIRIVNSLVWYAQRLRRFADIQSLGWNDAEQARHIGVRPYFLKEYRKGVKTMGTKGIRRALQALLAADFELKAGSNREPAMVLQLMVSRWLAPVRRSGTVVEKG